MRLRFQYSKNRTLKCAFLPLFAYFMLSSVSYIYKLGYPASKDINTHSSNHLVNKYDGVALSATSNQSGSSIAYTLVKPIYLIGQNNLTISGDSINGKSAACIALLNCSNIHITRCKLMNSSSQGIYLYNCTNVLIDSCFFNNVSAGVFVHIGSNIKVLNNEFLQMRGPFPAGNFVQFNGVTGGGNQINYNKCEDVLGAGTNPNPGAGDGLSLYQCNGIPTSPIQIIGNWIRGGGTNTGSMGMAGIVAGDGGNSSWQVIKNNILVNPGYAGIQVISGSNISVKYNQIYSAKFPWSGVGISSSNYTNTPASNDTIAYNTIYWLAGYLNMGKRDTVWKPHVTTILNPRPVGWDTNITNSPINGSILPLSIISYENLLASSTKKIY